jgi:hypothetical protein
METANSPRRSPWPMAAVLAVSLVLARPSTAGAADAAVEKTPDFSASERALFMSDQLSALQAPSTLNYRFRKSGSLETGFDDNVKVNVRRKSDGSCCTASAEFFSGNHRLAMPDTEDALGNPVIMYFLERDVREMQRLTKGQPNHFRKRIRMAIYDGATLSDVQLLFRGKPVAGREIVISPYLSDPNRSRFETLASKQYVFTLSDAVPGGVYGIRTLVKGADATAAPLIAEELLVAGADRKSTP